ncbi:MAG TPA: response regulator [Candidatus Angelobacter sp.]|nr:response regulator [Candidatus Angelobacter sp.]
MVANRRRIAVVNDDPSFLELVNDVLEQEGAYEVFTYRDEETSLAELRAIRPELIIIDILVGGTPSGWELALLAGADATLGPVPIIVSTPDLPGLGRRVSELREVANVRVLSKPFSLDELRATVHEAVANRREADPGAPAAG